MIDWEDQWAQFAPHFREGKAHIPLKGKTLRLIPGPGFGDLSHPTTQLMLEMLTEEELSSPVIDIGCGSGILALSALTLGAPFAIGVDIDPNALIHTEKNGKLNELEKRLTLQESLAPLEGKYLFLMNMILPEQKQIAPSQWNQTARRWITSGILASQQEEYLHLTQQWGWTLLEVRQRGEWLGFRFIV